jgi:hypothetical protein
MRSRRNFEAISKARPVCLPTTRLRQAAGANTEAGAVQAEVHMHAGQQLYATAEAEAHFHHKRRTVRTTMIARTITSIANSNRSDGGRNRKRRSTSLSSPVERAGQPAMLPAYPTTLAAMLPDVFLQGELSGAFNCRGFLKNAGERIESHSCLARHQVCPETPRCTADRMSCRSMRFRRH